MDETALIAFGVLMEETARELLGETGDFAFVEAANDNEEEMLYSDDEDEESGVESTTSREDSQEASIDADSASVSSGSQYSSEETE